MDANCVQENLSKGVATAMRAVSTRGAMPITTKLLMEAKDGFIKLTGTDLSMMISTWVPALVTEEGSVAVPAKVLNDYISSVDSESVELTREGDNAVLKLSAGRSKVNINGQQAAEFPPAPDVFGEEGEHFVIKADGPALRKGIQKVAIAAATEESRPILTGVQLKITQDEMSYTMAAADGFRLAVHTEQLQEPSPIDGEFVIPAKSLQELARVLAGVEDEVELIVHPDLTNIMFRTNSPEKVEMTTNLLSGTFPEWSGLVPSEWTSRTEVDAAELQRAVKSAAIFARDGSNIILMHYGHTATGKPKLQVSATSEELGNNREGIIPSEVEGDESKIAFNHRYMQDAIAAVSDGGLIIETTTSSSPAVFKPKDGDKTLQVVMPMFVQWEGHKDELTDEPELDDLQEPEAGEETVTADLGEDDGQEEDSAPENDEGDTPPENTAEGVAGEEAAQGPEEMVYEPFDTTAPETEAVPAGAEAC